MSSTSTPTLEQYQTAVAVLRALPTDITVLRGWDDATLLAANELHAEAGRAHGAAGAAIAGELAHRSRPELGGDGLARRSGYRTVENLLKTTTGATKEQVITAVAAGTLLVKTADEGTVDSATGEVREATQPWLRVVAVEVAAGRISTSASRSIASGLGSPNSAITAEQLAAAAVDLVTQALGGVDADRLYRNARALRDELDLAGIKIREDEARELRGLTHYPVPAGGGVATWRMDPETYAHFVDFYDRTTSPKRGGVRFVDPAKVEKVRKIADDPRTHKQLASDALLHFLKAGAEADPSVMLGTGAPVIRVTVAEEALTSGVGFGRVDGQVQPVSLDTVRRLMEGGRVIRVGFDPNGIHVEQAGDRLAQNRLVEDPLAENRLYNSRQREILATKFGGCMDPDCERPPSWTEAHHIRQVKRDDGKTTIANAILLCKYHHLLYHNRGYEISLDNEGTYWKIPPAAVGPEQTPILMPLKTRNLHDLGAAHQRAQTAQAQAERTKTATEASAAS